MGIPGDLHPSILNWMEAQTTGESTDVESLLSAALRNVHAHGNPRLRLLAPSTLAKFRSLDRFNAGSGCVCRITWGSVVHLDDCSCRTITTGGLHFSAVDYGDAISLNELMQQRLTAIDKDERIQCTLLSVSAGIVARELKHKTVPSRQRVLRTASELRWEEWSAAQPVATSDGAAKSANEMNIFSLRHDIAQPNQDRDYRSLALSLGPFLEARALTIRVFDVLHSGSGETALQINVIGSLDIGSKMGFIDILASNGHMRWLQPAANTRPRAWRDWLIQLDDFVVVYPTLDINHMLDDKGVGEASPPWVTCRQCRRQAKTPLASSKFYRSKNSPVNGLKLSFSKTPTRWIPRGRCRQIRTGE